MMDRFLKGIKDSRREILLEIYNNNYPVIRNFVLQNNGTVDDAKDVFQDVLVSLYRKLVKQDIVLTSSFNVYIFNIGKYTWFRHLKRQKRRSDLNLNLAQFDLSQELGQEEKFKLYQKVFDQLGSDCKKVLSLFFQHKTFNEIAEIMEYKTPAYAKRKKYLCKNKLVDLIRNHPDFDSLNYERRG